VVDAVASSIVQVEGRRRPASGVVFDADLVLTTMRAIGGEDGLCVRSHDDRTREATLAGWDPATGLALLKVDELNGAALAPDEELPRAGHLVIAVARSWSNVVTASTGNVAIIGGPFRTGRRRAIEQVIRVTVPMHDGFAGAPLVSPAGRVIGVATAAAIRGLGVVIPARIAWQAARDIHRLGRPRRGFLGIAAHAVRLLERQRAPDGSDLALLVMAVTPGSPADTAGLRVGDVLLGLDDHHLQSAEELLDLLTAERIGQPVTLSVMRGETAQKIPVTVGEREASA
jgi:S1-C subfamily serine protease